MSGSLREWEILWEHMICGQVFPQLYQVLPNFHECFCNLVDEREKILSEHSVKKKGKQLVYFDYQNVNSLCLRHHYVNCLNVLVAIVSIKLI